MQLTKFGVWSRRCVGAEHVQATQVRLHNQQGCELYNNRSISFPRQVIGLGSSAIQRLNLVTEFISLVLGEKAMSSTPLSKPPSQALMLEIIARYWRKKDRLSVQFENYASYFDNYRSTCQGLFIGLNNEAKAISIQTHEEMIEIVDLIWNLVGTGTRSCCRPAIRSILPNGNTTDPTLVAKSHNSINLVLRLWLHVEIQDPRFLAGSKTIMWNDESELKDFMRDQFKAPILTATGDSWNDILDNRFKAVNLYRFCGVRFCWTSNLLEHLHFDKELRIITVFSMKQCLQDQLDWYQPQNRPLCLWLTELQWY